MRRYVFPMLVACNLAAAGALLWLWVTPEGRLRDVQWNAPAPRRVDYGAMMPTLPSIPKPDSGQYLAMLDRPIFSITRRPPPPPPPPPPAPPVDHLAMARLSGTFEGGGVGGILINIAGKDRRVRLNESVEGWSIQSIRGRDVTFTRDGQTRTLQLPRAALNSYTGLPRAPVGVTPGAAGGGLIGGGPNAARVSPRPVESGNAARPEQPRATFGGTSR